MEFNNRIVLKDTMKWKDTMILWTTMKSELLWKIIKFIKQIKNENFKRTNIKQN